LELAGIFLRLRESVRLKAPMASMQATKAMTAARMEGVIN